MITLGKLKLNARTTMELADWYKLAKHDWRGLEMGFNDIGVWSCDKNGWTTPLPSKVNLAPRAIIAQRTPMGQVNKTAMTARLNRLIAASGVKTGKEFSALLTKQLTSVTLQVPKKRLEENIDKNYRQVFGYWRRDRHIVLVPAGNNPLGDYMILSMPESVDWMMYLVGVCGKEEFIKENPFNEGTAGHWKFLGPGGYSTLKKARDFEIFMGIGTRLPPPQPVLPKAPALQGRLRSQDIKARRALRKKGHVPLGGIIWGSGMNYSYSGLAAQRVEIEGQRMLKKHG